MAGARLIMLEMCGRKGSPARETEVRMSSPPSEV
jgi:hypothetical protein